MNNITIRKTEQSELGEISRIENECFSSPWSEKDLAVAMSNPAFHCLSAVCGDKCVGYVMMYNVTDEGEIANVAVSDEYRRRGIGEALMNEALDLAKDNGVVIVYLEVRYSNTAARSLYTKLGFAEIGLRKNYYKSPTEDAVLMAKGI